MEDPGGDFGIYQTIGLILFLILAGAFFSFLNAVLVFCRKPRLRAMIETDPKKYSGLIASIEKFAFYQASLRMTVNFLGLLAGAVSGSAFRAPLSGFLNGLGFGALSANFSALLLIAVLTALVFLFLGEALARPLAAAAPESFVIFFFPLIKVIRIIFSPVAAANILFSSFLGKLFSAGEKPRGPGGGMTEEELRIALLEGEKSGIVESEERTMVEGVFYLGDRPVGVFMTHRSEIKWLDIDADAEETKKTLAEAGSQLCFPVASGNLDEVAGMVSAEDLLKAMLGGVWPGLRSVMRAPYFVPETMPAIKAFEAFKKVEADSLFVMDEYGGFAGLLTVRNLIEEIVGELSASVTEGEDIVQKEDGVWLAGGSVNIDDAAKALKLESLGEGKSEYHTLAGFILSLAGEIPGPGASFEYSGYRFKIIEMDGNRIDKVSITRAAV